MITILTIILIVIKILGSIFSLVSAIQNVVYNHKFEKHEIGKKK